MILCANVACAKSEPSAKEVFRRDGPGVTVLGLTVDREISDEEATSLLRKHAANLVHNIWTEIFLGTDESELWVAGLGLGQLPPAVRKRHVTGVISKPELRSTLWRAVSAKGKLNIAVSRPASRTAVELVGERLMDGDADILRLAACEGEGGHLTAFVRKRSGVSREEGSELQRLLASVATLLAPYQGMVEVILRPDDQFEDPCFPSDYRFLFHTEGSSRTSDSMKWALAQTRCWVESQNGRPFKPRCVRLAVADIHLPEDR